MPVPGSRSGAEMMKYKCLSVKFYDIFICYDSSSLEQFSRCSRISPKLAQGPSNLSTMQFLQINKHTKSYDVLVSTVLGEHIKTNGSLLQEVTFSES